VTSVLQGVAGTQGAGNGGEVAVGVQGLLSMSGIGNR
jgi:hypothetical protein